MQGLRCYFISMSGKSPTKFEVTSRHDHSCLLGRKPSTQTNKQKQTESYIVFKYFKVVSDTKEIDSTTK